jgi:multisubunit Na+/H+ antiporter MnhF subunit
MKNNWIKVSIVVVLVLLAAFSRLIPHPTNFTAIGALAIFGAYTIQNKWLSSILPLLAMWVSDLVINNIVYVSYTNTMVWFSEGFLWIYAGVLSQSFISWFIVSDNKFTNVIGSSLFGAIAFFILSNFGVWAGSTMYPNTLSGLATCFAAGIPFFANTLAGNLFFSFILFGSYFFIEKKANAFQTA